VAEVRWTRQHGLGLAYSCSLMPNGSRITETNHVRSCILKLDLFVICVTVVNITRHFRSQFRHLHAQTDIHIISFLWRKSLPSTYRAICIYIFIYKHFVKLKEIRLFLLIGNLVLEQKSKWKLSLERRKNWTQKQESVAIFNLVGYRALIMCIRSVSVSSTDNAQLCSCTCIYEQKNMF